MSDMSTKAGSDFGTEPSKSETATTVASGQGFHQNVHVFRAIAILLIVGAHTLPSFSWENYPGFGRAVDILCNQSSIYFFFIAGFLFRFLSPRFEKRRYYTQKAKTVLLPYLLVSIPALIIFTTLIEREGVWHWFYDQPVWEQVVLFLITGKHLAPLWFVPTITLFYLAAPLLLRLDKSYPAFYWSLLPLLAVAILMGRDGAYGPLDKARYLAVAYLFGMYYQRHYHVFKEIAERYWFVLFFVGCCGYYLCWIDYDTPTAPVYQMVQKLGWAPLFLVMLDQMSRVIGNRLDYIAAVSFGIFFVHAYFISGLKVAYTSIFTGQIAGGSQAVMLDGTPLFYFLYLIMVVIASLATIKLAQIVLGKKSRMLLGA